jgi:hypothetical protein
LNPQKEVEKLPFEKNNIITIDQIIKNLEQKELEKKVISKPESETEDF